MATLTTGKIAVVIFENFLETFESQQMLLNKVDHWVPNAAQMQNANNFIWRSVQQHAPVISGWDMTGQEQGIIQETYPASLGTPTNDIVSLRADDMRDTIFWENRGKASGSRQASALNSAIASAMAVQGSLFYRSNTTSGFTFIAAAQALMNERQLMKDKRYFLLNDRDSYQYAQDLAARQTLQGRPENAAWQMGQVGSNVAEFDVFVGSFLPNIAGGTSPDTTVVGNQSFAPQGGTVSATGAVSNVDYREAVIPVTDASGYNVGDKVYFTNAGVPVYALGLDDKVVTDSPMTFTVIAKDVSGANGLTVYPKPIAVNDAGLSTLEKAYANVNTQILTGAVVVRMNTDLNVRTNLYWDKNAVEVIGGTIPANFFKEFAGKKVISTTMKNGQPVYMIYDGNMLTMQFSFRIFTWYGITIRNPSAVGVAVDYYSTT